MPIYELGIVNRASFNYNLLGRLIISSYTDRFLPAPNNPNITFTPDAIPLSIDPLFIDKTGKIESQFNKINNVLSIISSDFEKFVEFLKMFYPIFESRFNPDELIRGLEFHAKITLLDSKKENRLWKDMQHLEKSNLKNILSESFKDSFDVYEISLTNGSPLKDDYHRIKITPSNITPNNELGFDIIRRFTNYRKFEEYLSVFQQEFNQLKSNFGDVDGV